jgi:glycosyltransferase involved in cell wall biosynthesis
MEKNLLRSADIVFAITQNLADRKRRLNPNTYLVPNVGDVAHFGRVHREILQVPEDIIRIPRPRLGYIGALARYRINFGLVDYLARERPDWSFIMIGPVTDEAGDSVLPRRPNLHWLGPRDYEELPGYITGFDACFLPYDINDHTSNAFPLKFYEFLATGKPLVCAAFPALEEYTSLVPLPRTQESFLSSLEAVLKNDSREAQEHRLKVASVNSWEHRIRRMTDLIYRHLQEDGG